VPRLPLGAAGGAASKLSPFVLPPKAPSMAAGIAQQQQGKQVQGQEATWRVQAVRAKFLAVEGLLAAPLGAPLAAVADQAVVCDDA
jgi:hypothetical protein